MEHSLGLRMRVAFRIVAGIAISSIGSLIASLGSSSVFSNSIFSNFLIGILIWLLAAFIGLVIALEGIIVLIEETISSTKQRE